MSAEELPIAQACIPTTVEAISIEAATEMSIVFKALTDPLRVRMLAAIASDSRGECCVCDLAELANVSQPTVSHHLRVLKDSGLVTSQRRATWVWYRLAPGREPTVSTLLTILNARPVPANARTSA